MTLTPDILDPHLVPDGWPEMAARLALALLIGAACGWDREREGRAAGLRTYMLVCVGAAGFSMIGMELLADIGPGDGSTRYDPSRIVAGIVTGIGFLGAGTIIQSGGKVTGLTTAAGLWAIAAAGAASGVGQYPLAILLGVFTLLVLAFLKMADRWIGPATRDDDR